MNWPTITTLHNLAIALGLSNTNEISKTIFKSTECGCVFNETLSGVTIAGYAEGADAECPNHELNYPFTMVEFYLALEEADAEGVEMFDEWNNEDWEGVMPDDVQDTIDDDNNQRAADMNAVLSDIGSTYL